MAYVVPITDMRRERILDAVDDIDAAVTNPAVPESDRGPTVDAQVKRLLSGGPPIGSNQEREQLEFQRRTSSGSSCSGSSDVSSRRRTVCLTRGARRLQREAHQANN
jgi:hypothetical protein